MASEHTPSVASLPVAVEKPPCGLKSDGSGDPNIAPQDATNSLLECVSKNFPISTGSRMGSSVPCRCCKSSGCNECPMREDKSLRAVSGAIYRASPVRTPCSGEGKISSTRGGGGALKVLSLIVSLESMTCVTRLRILRLRRIKIGSSSPPKKKFLCPWIIIIVRTVIGSAFYTSRMFDFQSHFFFNLLFITF